MLKIRGLDVGRKQRRNDSLTPVLCLRYPGSLGGSNQHHQATVPVHIPHIRYSQTPDETMRAALTQPIRSMASRRFVVAHAPRSPLFQSQLCAAAFSLQMIFICEFLCAARAGTCSFATIERIATTDPRMSGAVVHGDMVYLSGQVPVDFNAPLKEQVETTLAKVSYS